MVSREIKKPQTTYVNYKSDNLKITDVRSFNHCVVSSESYMVINQYSNNININRYELNYS